MSKWRLLIHEDGDDSASYTEYDTEHEAIEFLAEFCAEWEKAIDENDKGYHINFSTDGRAIIETDSEIVAFACVFPPLITEEVEL